MNIAIAIIGILFCLVFIVLLVALAWAEVKAAPARAELRRLVLAEFFKAAAGPSRGFRVGDGGPEMFVNIRGVSSRDDKI